MSLFVVALRAPVCSGSRVVLTWQGFSLREPTREEILLGGIY